MRHLILILLTSLAGAQTVKYTQVSAQIKDASGGIYANCTWSVIFVGQSLTPGVSYSPAPLLVGQQGTCDSSGNLTVTLVDNVLGVSPSPSQWSFSIASAPGYPGGVYSRANMLVTVTGTTQNLTSTFSALMPLLPQTAINLSAPPAIGNVTPNTGAFKLTSVTNSGIFTNTQMNQYATSLIGGIPFDFYHSVQGFPGFTTEGGTFGVAIPNTAAIGEADGVVGMVSSSCNSSGRTVCNAVAVSGHARALANGAAVWGHNSTVDNATGTTGTNIIGGEFDIGVRSDQSAGYVHGVDIFLSPQPGSTMPANLSAAGIEIGASLLNSRWFAGLFISGASIQSSGQGIYIDQNCALGGGACNSPKITLVGQDGSNVQHSGSWFTDSNGNIVLLAGATGLGMKPPQSTFANLGASAANGTVVYCTDCKNIPDNGATAGAACAGSGQGTVARRDNNRWDCN